MPPAPAGGWPDGGPCCWPGGGKPPLDGNGGPPIPPGGPPAFIGGKDGIPVSKSACHMESMKKTRLAIRGEASHTRRWRTHSWRRGKRRTTWWHHTWGKHTWGKWWSSTCWKTVCEFRNETLMRRMRTSKRWRRKAHWWSSKCGRSGGEMLRSESEATWGRTSTCLISRGDLVNYALRLVVS